MLLVVLEVSLQTFFFVSTLSSILHVLRNFSARLTAHKIKFLPLRLITLEGQRIHFNIFRLSLGCAGLLVGYPFDTVKVHLQTQDFKNPLYRGTYDCLKKIIKKDSVGGLYRGISSPLASISVLNAIVFGVYGNVQRRTNDPNSLMAHFWAGSAAGLSQTLICSPMELVKSRLQIQNNIPNAIQHKHPFSCLRHIWKNEGTRGVFKGFGITVARDVPGKL